jgi:uncharacterized heparinase superfamily protein
MLKGPARTLRTLAALRPGQLAMLVWRRGLQPRLRRRPAVPDAPAFGDALAFQFLNRERVFAPGEFNWQPAGEHRLWIYNLHYFGYLNDTAYPLAQQLALIEHWIAANPKGYGPGWEAYPTSLRLVNWLRWRDRNGGDEAAASEPWASIDASIREQADWLSRHLETHILANHYFENLKALVFVAATLGGRAGRFRQARLEMKLLRELGEQFLDDGGHYERSPSYHCLLLDGLLDLIELDQRRPGVLSGVLSQALHSTATAALDALRAMELPGDAYPLFNDSAFDSAPRPSALYARALDLGLGWEIPEPPAQIALKNFGVFGWRSERAGVMAIKCGAVGPRYQPGHTHCDLLSFEWYLGGRPIVVDTGVLEYEPGPLRRYVRSTAAHNTVAIAGEEQSEVWGEFRVARRAAVLAGGVASTAEGVEFLGEIEGFHAAGSALHHQRRLGYRDAGAGVTIYVEDLITGRGDYDLSSRLLFHPSITLEHDTAGTWHVFRHKRFIATLETRGVDCELVDAPYCPEFGLALPARQLVMRTRCALPTRLSYTFKLAH